MKNNLFTKECRNERDVEQYIGKLLRCGVILACVITTLGGIIYIIQSDGKMPNYGEPFAGVQQYLREFNTIMPRVLDFDGAAIIQLGVIVLIATPIIRVAFSAISFLVEKDYLYVVITLIVLSIIIANMFLGFH